MALRQSKTHCEVNKAAKNAKETKNTNLLTQECSLSPRL